MNIGNIKKIGDKFSEYIFKDFLRKLVSENLIENKTACVTDPESAIHAVF